MTAIGPIERRALHEELADQLRRAIIHGELEPGTRISEKNLCEQFGVSRTPIREALKTLSAEGLVQLSQNRGATVTKLTRRDLEDAFPVMGALEALAGELAARKATPAQIERMQELQSRMVAMFERGDRRGYFRANEDIHKLILDTADNAYLARLHRSVSAQVRRPRYQANLSPERWSAAVAEHEEIAEAFSRRSAARLGRLLKNHIANKLTALLAALDGDE